MRWYGDLAGTLRRRFGIGRASISSEGVDSARDFALPNSGVALVSNDYDVSDISNSGVRSALKVSMTNSPTASASGNPMATESHMTYDSPQPMNTGGWVVGDRVTLTTKGSGTHDKVVACETFLEILGGNVANAVIYEAIIKEIAEGSNVGGLAGFYFPNLQDAHPDLLERVGVLAAFANQDPRAVIQNMGLYLDAKLRPLAPAQHIGVSPNRYYSAPYRWLGYNWTAMGRWDLCPVYVPERVRVRRLGLALNTANAAGRARIGMYTAQQGAVGVLVGNTGELTLDPVGEIEGGVDFTIDPGMYWLVVQTNVAANIGYHAPQHTGYNAAMYGQSTGLLSDGNTQRSAYVNTGVYAPFPATAAIVPTFVNQDSEAHLWYRTL